MADRAGRIEPVLFEPLPERAGQGSISATIEVRHIRRRRRGRGAKKLLENPFPPENRRGPGGIGGQRQNAALGQNPPARGAFHRDPLELLAADTFDPVVASQPSIDPGKVGVDEFQHAAILAHDVGKKEAGLLSHRLAKSGVVGGEDVRVRSRAGEEPRLQPLLSEVLRQGVRPWVAQHPLNLGGEHLGVRQAAIAGQLEKLVIRHTAPDKIGQPAGELKGRDRVNRPGVVRLGVELDTKEKIRRRERRLEDHPEGVLDGALVVNHSPAKLDETLKLTILKGAPVRPGYKALDGLADVAQMRTPILHQGAHDHPGRLSRRLLQFKKPDLEPVDKQIAIAAKGGGGVARAVIIIEQGYAEAVLALDADRDLLGRFSEAARRQARQIQAKSLVFSDGDHLVAYR